VTKKSDYDRATEITKLAGRDPNNESDRFKSVLEHIMQFDKHGKLVRPLPARGTDGNKD
jgi:hypothetical protein